MKLGKKGQTFEMFGSLAVGLAAFTILMAVTFLILAQGLSQTEDFATSNSTLDELVSYTNSTSVALVNSLDTMSVGCSRVMNSSDGSVGVVIGPGNYTCDSSGLNLNDTTGAGGAWNATVSVNYSYKRTTEAWNATNTLTGAAATMPPWMPLIVIVVVGTALVALIGRFKRRS